MKPAVIIRDTLHGYILYNEDGRPVVSLRGYNNLEWMAKERGYTVVPLNSRVGRTIQDKITQRA